MDEISQYPPAPELAPPPRKFPVWVIVLIVVLVLCCCCIGVLGLVIAFFDPISQELGLSSVLPLVSII